MPLRRREPRVDNPRAPGPRRPAPRTTTPTASPPAPGVVHRPSNRPAGVATELHYRSYERSPADREARGEQPPLPHHTEAIAPAPGVSMPRYTADDVLAMLQGSPNRLPVGGVAGQEESTGVRPFTISEIPPFRPKQDVVVEERNLFTGEWRPVQPGTALETTTQTTSEEEQLSTPKGVEDDSTYYRDPPPLAPSPSPAPQRGIKRDLSAGELPPAQRLDLRTSPPSPIHVGPMRTSTPTDLDPSITSVAPTTKRMDPRIASAQLRTEAQRHAPAPLPQPTPSTSQRSFSEIAASPAPLAQQREPMMTTTETPRKAGIPPIQVDVLPNWTGHFKALKEILGVAPSARPMGKGVRFLPRSVEEFRAVQAYLEEARRREPLISGHTFALESDRPHKVAVSGLPRDTPVEELLHDMGLIVGTTPTYARMIPPRRGRPKTIFFVQFPHLPREQLQRLYDIKELLCMPGVEVREWTRRPGPPQCHRCQVFGHSSAGCFRDPRCVRCGGPHPAADCPRDSAPLKCCNCGGSHAANSRQCPTLKKEARKRGIKLQAPLPRPPQIQPKKAEHLTAAPTTPLPPPPPPTHSEPTQAHNLMAPANGPTERRAARGKKKKKKKKKKTEEAPPGPPGSGKITLPAPKAPAEKPVRHAKAIRPPRPAASSEDRREAEPARLPQPAAPAPATYPHHQEELQAAIEVLLEVLHQLQSGASPLEAVSHGLSRLCSLYRRGSTEPAGENALRGPQTASAAPSCP